MKLIYKIILPFVALLIIILSIFGYLIYYLNIQQQYITDNNNSIVQINNYSNQIQNLQNEIEQSVLSYRIDKKESNVNAIKADDNAINNLLGQMQVYITESDGLDLISEYRNNRQTVIEIRYQLLDAIKSGNNFLIQKDFDSWSKQTDIVEQNLADFSANQIKTIQITTDNYRQIIIRVYRIAIGLVALLVFSILLLLVYLRFLIIEPIKNLTKWSKKLAKGDFSLHQVKYREDEIGQLSQSLQGMSEKLENYYLHLQDEVRLKSLELDRSKQSEQRKDNFISMASHELKTPLTSLKVYNQMLQKKLEGKVDHQIVGFSLKMEKQINRLIALVEGLLDISRIKSGKMELVYSDFNLNDLLEETVQELRQVHLGRQIVFQNRNTILVTADKERITQVIINLISNAVKYSSFDKQIIITSEVKGNKAMVFVKDFGIGIPKNQQRKIFNRFYQVPNKMANVYPGLGVGLYIADEIIKHHKGKLYVESQEGKGSVFIFTIPIKVEIKNHQGHKK